jgi:hypothetical protein
MEATVKYRSPRGLKSYGASGAERLAHLADFLDTVDPRRVTFSFWYDSESGGGCPVGIVAAEEPWFQAQGLTLSRGERLSDCHPVYDGATEWRALARFFEIGIEDLRHLFDRSGYDANVRPHPREVAGKIRAFLAAKVEAA